MISFKVMRRVFGRPEALFGSSFGSVPTGLRFKSYGCDSPALKGIVGTSTIPRTFSAKERSMLLKEFRESKLTDFHPGISGGYLTGKSQLTSAQHLAPTDVSMAWWRCPTCEHTFRRRVFDHVFCHDGQCPSCLKLPALDAKYGELSGRFLTRTGTSKLFAQKETGATSQDVAFLKGNTRQYAPMLAAGWESHGLKKYSPNGDVMVSNKLDGIRCVALFDEKNKDIHFMSRTGSVLESCDHLVPALRPLFKRDPELVLDGELYTHLHFKDFQEVFSAVRTTREHRTPEVHALQKRLEYHIFDMMYFSPTVTKLPKDAGFAQRLAYLKDHVKGPMLRVVDAEMTKASQVDGLMEKAMKAGYEGIMIRDPNSLYTHGKRSVNLLKHKKMFDSEYEIIRAVEGKGKFAGMVGAFICKTPSGKQFAANPSVSEVLRKDLWKKRDSYVGQMGTVQYQELSRDGVPRFPILKCVRGAKDGSNWL